MSQAFQHLSTPLPEQAVGPGARWSVLFHMDFRGLEVYHVVEVTLLELDENPAKLGVEVSEHAPSQVMSTPSMAADASATLRKLTTTGCGSVRIRFDELAPESTMDRRSTTETDASTGGQSQRLIAVAEVHTEITPG